MIVAHARSSSREAMRPLAYLVFAALVVELPRSPHPADRFTPDDYAVLQAVLRTKAGPAWPANTWLASELITQPLRTTSVGVDTAGVTSVLVRDFVRRNRAARPVDSRTAAALGLPLADSAQLAQLFPRRGTARAPAAVAAAVVWISRAGFDGQDAAMVRVRQYCGPLCGWDWLVLLERHGGQWSPTRTITYVRS